MKRIQMKDLKERMQQKKQRKEEKYQEKKVKRENSAFGKAMKKAIPVLNKISILLHAVWAGVLYFVMEALSRHSVIKAWEYMTTSPVTFLFNTYMIFASLFLVYIVRRRVFLRVIISVFWLILGIVNCYMLSVRVTPFNAQDLKVIDDALTMLDKYFTGPQGVLIIAAIIIVISWLVICGNVGEFIQERCTVLRQLSCKLFRSVQSLH